MPAARATASTGRRQGDVMETSRFRSCFVAAPASVDTSTLTSALHARGVSVWDTSTELVPGSRWSSAIEQAIQDADFVCAVISDSAENASVFLELGLSIALGKPRLLFVAPKAVVPASLFEFPYARASVKDETAIAFHLENFLAHGASRPSGLPTRSSPRPSPTLAAQVGSALSLIASWEAQTAPPSEADVVNLLAAVFEAAGHVASITPRSSHSGRLADLAVWVDELQSAIGNPLVVEVKTRLQSPYVAVDQLHSVLAEFRAPLGLLATLEPAGDSPVGVDLGRYPNVVAMGVREIVASLAQGSFAQALLSRRNALVHSAA